MALSSIENYSAVSRNSSPTSLWSLQKKILSLPKHQIPKCIADAVESTKNKKVPMEQHVETLTLQFNNFLSNQMNNDNTSEAVYTPATLELYDAIVWEFNAPFHWRIRPQQVEDFYRIGLMSSQRHCEVAVGTGLFLRQWATTKTRQPPKLEQVTLMDLSVSSLESCYNRLQEVDLFQHHVNVHKVQANILEPPPSHLCGNFDSVAANFLLHCLHGNSMQDKKAAIQSCATLLNPIHGVFFGSTILGKALDADAEAAGPYAISTNVVYNKLGIFGNRGDSFDDLATILKECFHSVAIWRIGYCAVWIARRPVGPNEQSLFTKYETILPPIE